MADPARIAHTIDSVRAEVTRWLMVAHAAEIDADRLQRQVMESARRVQRMVSIGEDLVEETRLAAERATHAADKAYSDTLELKHELDVRRESLARVSDFARATLAAWEAELQQAIAWQHRAEARVRAAEEWVRRAEAAVRAALSSVSSAESALGRCQRDQSRRNCNSEADRVNAARAALAAAQVDLRLAQRELQEARLELIAAKARVACCERAVKTATDATERAALAEVSLNEGYVQATFAGDYATNAQLRAQGATKSVEMQAAEAAAARTASVQAQRAAADAGARLRNAGTAYQECGRHGADAGRELSERMERLRSFDTAGGLG